ncbi:hypothetical protein M430DRAFT_194767 [Amorphotheca resinae ATCC 22711]|uniref:Uncharacterized protein n=1 Tax=Amorphotheca resinae ATCC 22711 TaxID=857342 RepID=A0A2T3AP30_AMORE|nr:hypothetical protein M430DRAFT_194767 [Amorphotheca resinae ATCC 22711]PSS06687.1 hypothetical protein M430DRAFT_194767 [Amorphotheca resinae ATCC 22711]
MWRGRPLPRSTKPRAVSPIGPVHRTKYVTWAFVEFAARCPPDVQKDTRIVAVCGIPDFGAASNGPQ